MAEISAEGGSWITRALCDDGRVRVVAVEADEVADELRQAHGLTGSATRLAAEATVASLLLAAYAKGDEKLSLQAALTHPAARFMGELDPAHGFRGRLTPAALDDEPDLNALAGLLLVAKYDRAKEVYRGITAVNGTSITAALHSHLVDSAQVHGALCTSVALDETGRVQTAVGVLVERLPAEAGQLHHEPQAFHDRWGDLHGADATTVLADFHGRSLRGSAVELLDIRPVFWGCSCDRGRLLGALAGLGAAELLAMADEDRGAQVRCDYCAKNYEISEAELRDLAASETAVT